MSHVSAIDPESERVIAVQVENEVGVLGAARDHCPAADAALDWRVPAALSDVVGTGTWRNAVDGSAAADERFMAFGYAQHIAHVAAAGRALHDVPLFVNAWLNSDQAPEAIAFAGGNRPGLYPSGGPLPHVADIWTATAPGLTLAADIYFGDFSTWCARYREANDGVLLIPEMPSTLASVANIHVAVGEYGAALAAPFGADGLDPDSDHTVVHALRTSFLTLRNVRTPLVEALRSGRATGFALESIAPCERELDGVTLRIAPDRSDARDTQPLGWGIVFRDPDGTFTALGAGFALEVVTHGRHLVRDVQTGHFVDNAWQTKQRLNGDETNSGTCVRMPHRDPGICYAADGDIPLRITRFSISDWTA